MLIGVPKEIKDNEFRVGLHPSTVRELTAKGHRVIVEKGAVTLIIDVSIDQSSTAETSRPNSHSQPTYIVDDVVHYCVPNMPGAVARTSTFALHNATLPFALALTDKGFRRVLADDPYLCIGLNVHEGWITHRAIADAMKLPYVASKEALRR